MTDLDDVGDHVYGSPDALLALTIRDATAFGVTRLELTPHAGGGAERYVLTREIAGLMPGRRAWQVSTEDGAELLRLLRGTQVPVLPDYVMGLDGTTYSLELYNGFNRISFSWWDTLPRGWQGLAAIVEKLQLLQVGPGRGTS